MRQDKGKEDVGEVQEELMDNIKKNVCGLPFPAAFTKGITVKEIIDIYAMQAEKYGVIGCLASDANKYMLPISIETLNIISVHTIPLEITREFEIVPKHLGERFLEKL